MKKVILALAVGLISTQVFAADISKVDANTAAVPQPDLQITLDQVTAQESQLVNRMKVLQAQETITTSQLQEVQALKKKMTDIGIVAKKPSK